MRPFYDTNIKTSLETLMKNQLWYKCVPKPRWSVRLAWLGEDPPHWYNHGSPSPPPHQEKYEWWGLPLPGTWGQPGSAPECHLVKHLNEISSTGSMSSQSSMILGSQGSQQHRAKVDRGWDIVKIAYENEDRICSSVWMKLSKNNQISTFLMT